VGGEVSGEVLKVGGRINVCETKRLRQGQAREQVESLGEIANADVRPVERDAPPVNRLSPDQNPEQRGLAAAVWPYPAHAIAGVWAVPDLFQNGLEAVGFAEVVRG